EDVIALDGGSPDFADRAKVFEGARQFAEGGGKLIKLEFPKTEIQMYGNTIILYTTYSYELESGGKRTTKSGRGTEIFVRRGNELVNVGWHLD
ncbi:MAG TPA: nuclear transport factor 2 family protein, partial [Pyrinomonadaceae bacterium]